MGIQNLIIEGDSSLVCSSLLDWSSSPDWVIETTILNCRNLLPRFFSWSVLKIPRVANFDAHNLAKAAAYCYLFGHVPIDVFPLDVVEEIPQEDYDAIGCIISS